MWSNMRFKRGVKERIPKLMVSEPGFAIDEGKLYIGSESGNIALSRDDHSHSADQVGADSKGSAEAVKIYAKDGYNEHAGVSALTEEDSASGALRLERLDGQTVQRAYVHTVGESGQAGTKGINLFADIATPQTIGGVTLIRRADGAYILNGTATVSANFGRRALTLAAGEYTLAANASADMAQESASPIVQVYSATAGVRSSVAVSNGTVVSGVSAKALIAASDYEMRIRIAKDAVYNNLAIRPMLVEGSYTAAAMPPYEPYSGGYASPSPDWPQPITPGLAGGKYQVRTHRGFYECTIPDGHGLGDARDKLVVDPVTGTGKWVACMAMEAMNGSGWSAYTSVSYPEGYYVAYRRLARPSVRPETVQTMCSVLPFRAYGYGLQTGETNHSLDSVGQSVFCKTKMPLEEWTACLNETPMTLLYRLATPIITPITLTPVSSSAAPVLPVEWMDYAPTPEVPVTMESVEKGKLWSVGRNLWDRAYTEDITSWTQTYATIYLNGFIPGESYIISATLIAGVAPTDAALTVSDADLGNVRTLFRYTDTGRKNYVFVAQTATMAVRIRWSGSAVAAQAVIAVTNWLTDIQLEAGTTATPYTPYTPYTGHTYDIPLPQPLRAGDSVELADGRYKQVVRRVWYVFTGQESVVKNNGVSGDGDNLYYIPKLAILRGWKYPQSLGLICSIAPGVAPHTYQSGVSIGSTGNLVFNFGKIGSNSAADVKAWLAAQNAAGTPVILEVDLAEPQTIDLPDSTQALLRSIVTAPGVAHLWFEGAVVPSMTAGVPHGTFADPAMPAVWDTLGHKADLDPATGKLPGILQGDIDCGFFEEETVDVHDVSAYTHKMMRVDGNQAATEDSSQTLEEHMVNPMAHQNIVLDGNAN